VLQTRSTLFTFAEKPLGFFSLLQAIPLHMYVLPSVPKES